MKTADYQALMEKHRAWPQVSSFFFPDIYIIKQIESDARKELERTNAELAASVARLREIVKVYLNRAESMLSSDTRSADQSEITILRQALSESPSDALKPLLEFVSDRAYHEGNSPTGDKARQLLKMYETNLHQK